MTIGMNKESDIVVNSMDRCAEMSMEGGRVYIWNVEGSKVWVNG